LRTLYFSRGYSTHDHRFLSAFVEAGLEVFYLQLETRGSSPDDRPLPQGVTPVAWAGGKGPATFSNGPTLLFDLKRVLREVKPDIVQAGPLQSAAFLTAVAGYKNLVSMSWGYDLLIDAERGPAWRWATRYTLERSAALIGDTEVIRQKAIDYGMQPEHIVTAPWGVDLEHFSPGKPRPQGERAFTLLSTRGWEPIYGVDVIARAFVLASREVQKIYGEDAVPLHLIMLGGGSLAGALRKIFLEGGVLENVSFPGQIGQTDLPRYYRCADLYVSASHSDGASISLLEAMACGIPALVSDIPGNREFVTPEENGWWFAGGDEQALARTILHAYERRLDLGRMGPAARRLAEEKADWRKNFPRLLHSYDLISG
jgi:glycosyltransferase involved in cell wall biosynthesis